MKTFCLGLPETPAVVDRAKAHFSERGLDNVEWIWGINAVLCGLDTSNPYEVDHPGSGFRIGQKLTGVGLGWYLAWSVCNALPDSHFLLFEQDVKLEPDFIPRFNQAMADVPPDFDWLFVGSCCTVNHPTEHIKGQVYEVKYPQCNHAQVVAKKCLPYVLATQRKLYGPVDCQLLRDTFPALKVYTVLPRLADQFDTYIPP
jgi:hypothetical protein